MAHGKNDIVGMMDCIVGGCDDGGRWARGNQTFGKRI